MPNILQKYHDSPKYFPRCEKGFIGPIGDDLPSLVPIVVALLLFFSIFALTLNTYNTKNDEIRKQTEMTSVARELKGDSLILDSASFAQKCEALKLKKYPYNFMVALYGTNVDMASVVADFSNASKNSDDLDYLTSDSVNFLKQDYQREVQDDTTDPGNGFLRTTTFVEKKSVFFCNYRMVGGTDFSASKKNYLLRFYPVAIQYPKALSATDVQYLIVPGLMTMVFWA